MTAQYFFWNLKDIPAGAGILAWGSVHVGWLLAMTVAGALLIRRYRKLDDASRARWLKVLAVIILCQEMVKNLLFTLSGEISFEHLPFHLCGISMFICTVYAFTARAMPGQMLYALVIPGALAALIFLDWTAYPALHFSSIHSFIIHGNLVLFGLLPICAGAVRPDWRMLPRILAFALVLCVPIYPLNKVLDTNFFFLNTPSPGSPLMPLAALLGNPGYIGGVIVLLILLWVLMYTPWSVYAKRKARL